MRRNKCLSPENAVNASRIWMNVDLLRRSRGLTWRQVCDDTGIALSSLNRAKNETREPQLYMCVIFSSYFHVTLDFLINGTAENEGEKRALALLAGPCSEMTKEQTSLLIDFARFIVDSNVGLS